MSEQQQNEFRGYARVEVMGHQQHFGMVTTEVYGGAVMFRVDQPELPEREETLTTDTWDGLDYLKAGSVVSRPKIPGLTVLVGAGSIYRIMPCTPEACLLAIEQNLRRPFILIRPPAAAQIEDGGASVFYPDSAHLSPRVDDFDGDDEELT